MTRLFVALVGLALAACSQGDAKQKKDDAKAPPAALPVSVIDVAPREVPVVFEAVGRTEGSREVQVRARVAGIVERQLYNEGERVRAGAALFQIERAPFEIELAQARGALAQEIARENLATQEAERLKGLADRRAISQKEADQASSALEQSRAAVQVARARVRQAKLNFSGSTVDAATGTVQMRAEVPNPRLELLPGQFVRVRITAGVERAIIVPQAAVLQNEGGRFVWVVAPDGRAAQRSIKAGSWVGKDWVVLDGLKGGDTVIVDNLARLRPGAAVAPKKAG